MFAEFQWECIRLKLTRTDNNKNVFRKPRNYNLWVTLVQEALLRIPYGLERDKVHGGDITALGDTNPSNVTVLSIGTVLTSRLLLCF